MSRPLSGKSGMVGTVPLESAVGARLALARADAHLTQQALADGIGCQAGYVSMAERGLRLPRLPVLVAWAMACGTTLSALMEGLEEQVGGTP